MNCPICCSPTTRRIFRKEEYWIRDCENCRHRYAEFTPSNEHVNQIYQDEYFCGGGAGYPDYLAEAKILSAHGSRYGTLLKKYTVPGTMLDVGAAAGFILKGFKESGWEGIGLEPNSSMASYGCTHFGLQIETGSLEQFLPNQQFDLVSMIQVIAHFFDIKRALQNAADITRPSGFWLIESWNRDSQLAHILGPHWPEYSPPSTLHWFSPASLNHLASQFGFLEVARGHPAKHFNGKHAKSLLKSKLRNSPLSWLLSGLTIIPDDIVIPYPPLDLFWILFQKVLVLGFLSYLITLIKIFGAVG